VYLFTLEWHISSHTRNWKEPSAVHPHLYPKKIESIFLTLSSGKLIQDEMARAIVLTSEQWFLLSQSGTENGRLIINLNEMQKKQQKTTRSLSKETSTIYFFKQFTYMYMYVLPIVCRIRSG
jgi:hypothetical protein